METVDGRTTAGTTTYLLIGMEGLWKDKASFHVPKGPHSFTHPPKTK